MHPKYDIDNMPGWEHYDEMIDQEQRYPAWMEQNQEGELP
jgi:hypothetical protein